MNNCIILSKNISQKVLNISINYVLRKFGLSYIIREISGKGCVAGNSVYMDKWFVIKYLPKLNAHLHYRLIDVSTLKELCRFV